MQKTLLFTAVSLALCSFANAAPLTTTQSVGTGSITRSITDTTENGSAQTSPVTKTLSFGKFNSSTGVLVDVTSGLAFNTGTLTLSAAGTKQSGSGTVSFASEGTISASSNLPGLAGFGQINEQLTNSCSDSGSCFPTGVNNLSNNAVLTRTDSSWLSPTAAAGTASLNSYVGTGNLTSTLTVTPSVSLTDEKRISSQSAKIEVAGLVGTQSLTYSYLQHANASFASGADTNSLSLGSLTEGGSGFSLFNLGDTSTTKLDMVSLQCVSGDCSAFNVSLSPLQNLLAGNSVAGTAALATNTVGHYAASYLLTFSDDTAVGATSTHLQNTLTLNVAAVPEPSSWALLSVGLLGLAFCRRKK